MELENEGFIYTISGKGTFVNVVDFEKITICRQEKLIESFSTKINELKNAGITKESLLEIIEEQYS